MADTTEIAPNDTIPALPPLPGVAHSYMPRARVMAKFGRSRAQG
jgi:hypothetical protein